MTDRDRIIELKRQAVNYAQEKADERGGLVCIDDEVDYLLANGVIVPPCKVGDTVYVLMETSCEDVDLAHTVCEFYNELHEDMCTLPRGKCPYKYIIRACEVNKSNILHFSEKFSKTVFLTKEEAEAELQKRGKVNA